MGRNTFETALPGMQVCWDGQHKGTSWLRKWEHGGTESTAHTLLGEKPKALNNSAERGKAEV